MNALLYKRVHIAGVLVLILAGIHPGTTQAQLMLVSSVPANGATGVSAAAPAVFTFNLAMDTNVSSASFTYNGGMLPIVPTGSWNAGHTVLTYTPVPAWPGNTNIQWQLIAIDATDSQFLAPSGSFSTGTGGGGGGGSDTNPITVFTLTKDLQYDQTNSATPTLDPDIPFTFFASTELASNRTATAVSLTLPNAAVSNLTQNPIAPEDYFLAAFYTNQTTFSNSWPDGTYMFKVTSNSTAQTVSVLLPSTMVQPNGPHVSNYAAAQTVNPSQPFTLTWDAFSGGTATDFVFVVVGTNFTTANPESNGSLNGTATSVLIPANTLPSNSTLDGTLSFYRVIFTTNASGYATFADKVSSTQFTVTTGSGGGTTGPLKLLNPAFVSGVFNFDITSGISQTFTVELKTNSTGTWQSLVTTSSASGDVRLADPHSTSNRFSLYRARNGP